ncbi:hypothetical protein [Photorhabdus bodei]|uniref:Uncharacterized protein n=1 Tax=Photorhabdus bodei TaxID=2029681 RepID=A0AAW6BCZ1_9GAMM|nr:hypothetical protein [Photorhabdus bodei]MCC8463736.1 hypothetical protein [Photorhabdus bodei]MDB6371069.1 hypothetical protein [Photorhabdus bodei]
MDNMSEFINACRKLKQNIIVLEKNYLNVRYIGDDGDLSKLIDITSNIQSFINKQGHELNTLISDLPGFINGISKDVDYSVNIIKGEINKSSPNISNIRDAIKDLMDHLTLKDKYLTECLSDKYRIRSKARIVRDDTKEYARDLPRIYNLLKESSNREHRDKINEIAGLMIEKNSAAFGLFSKIINDQRKIPFSIEDVIQNMELNQKKLSEEEIDALEQGTIIGIIGIIVGIVIAIGTAVVYPEIKAYYVASEKIAQKEKELVSYNSSLVTAYRMDNSTKDLSDACEGINYHYYTVIKKLQNDNNDLLVLVNKMQIDFGGSNWSKYINEYKLKLDGFKGKYTNFLDTLYQVANSQQKKK